MGTEYWRNPVVLLRVGQAGVIVIACVGCTTKRSLHIIPITLQQQSEAWNRGDVDGFMSAYWRSPDLTFASGGEVTRGFEDTLERYRRKYPTPEAMGRLTFSDLEIRRLGKDSAMVLGRWRLERTEPVGGLFTLVMQRMGDRWVIIHDHTSRAEP